MIIIHRFLIPVVLPLSIHPIVRDSLWLMSPSLADPIPTYLPFTCSSFFSYVPIIAMFRPGRQKPFTSILLFCVSLPLSILTQPAELYPSIDPNHHGAGEYASFHNYVHLSDSNPCFDRDTHTPQRCVPDFINAAFSLEVEVTNTCGEKHPTKWVRTFNVDIIESGSACNPVIRVRGVCVIRVIRDIQ